MSRNRAWLAFVLLPFLTGCLGAVAIPLVVGGTLTARGHRVRAATPVPQMVHAQTKAGKALEDEDLSSTKVVATSLKELPPPSGSSVATAADDRWQQFFEYASRPAPTEQGKEVVGTSALLVQPPSIERAVRQSCTAPVRAVVIDLDNGSQAFAPDRLAHAPADIAGGVERLRRAGIVVLWISRLPAAQASGVAQALRGSGLDPKGEDQLLLVRNVEDRKQLLRQDASKDVCIVAIAGEQRGAFDELFDFLRNPEGALGLESMFGDGWFLVPSLENGSPVTSSTDR